jgi:hypothetical protein
MEDQAPDLDVFLMTLQELGWNLLASRMLRYVSAYKRYCGRPITHKFFVVSKQ